MCGNVVIEPLAIENSAKVTKIISFNRIWTYSLHKQRKVGKEKEHGLLK
jgi:hypothetical protein